MQSLIKNQEKKIKELEILAEKDFLTNIYNRRGFINQLERFLTQFNSFSCGKFKARKSFVIKSFSIVFIDLDKLKIINDTFSHKAGDKVLKEVAILFQKSLRKADIVARWGGDEFIILLLGANEKQAFEIIEKLRKKLMKLKIIFQNKELKITASFGIINNFIKKYNKEPNLNIDHLIEKTDIAMYKAKKIFKGNTVVNI